MHGASTLLSESRSIYTNPESFHLFVPQNLLGALSFNLLVAPMFYTSRFYLISFLGALQVFQGLAIGPDQLVLKVDDAIATNVGSVLIGAVVQIRGLSDWTDEQVVDLAFVARSATLAAFDAVFKPPEKKSNEPAPPDDYNYPHIDRSRGSSLPLVTTTLVVDNTAYISSSMKGQADYLYITNQAGAGNNPGAVGVSRYTNLNPAHPCTGPVQDALQQCQLRSVGQSGHNSGAKCGEPMAAVAFCTTNNQRDLSGAKIVTVMGKTEKGLKIVAPCGDPSGPKPPVSQYSPSISCEMMTDQCVIGLCWAMGLFRLYIRYGAWIARY